MNDQMVGKNQRTAFIYALLTVLCWSTVASAFKTALAHTGFLTLLFIANLTAIVILLFAVITTGKLVTVFSFPPWVYLQSALMGFLNPFLYYLVLFKAYSLLPAQIAQPLNFIWPITLMLIAIPLLGHRFSIRSLVSLLISFSGVILIASQGNLKQFDIREPLGVFLALGSSVIWSVYWILNIRDSRDGITKLFLNFLFAGIFISILILFKGIDLRSATGTLASVYTGIFEMGLTFMLWYNALSKADDPARIANIIYLTPFFSMLIIALVLKEKILYTSLAGLILIVAGILVHRSGKFNPEINNRP